MCVKSSGVKLAYGNFALLACFAVLDFSPQRAPRLKVRSLRINGRKSNALPRQRRGLSIAVWEASFSRGMKSDENRVQAYSAALQLTKLYTSFFSGACMLSKKNSRVSGQIKKIILLEFLLLEFPVKPNIPHMFHLVFL
jgi:hypothetical protein